MILRSDIWWLLAWLLHKVVEHIPNSIVSKLLCNVDVLVHKALRQVLPEEPIVAGVTTSPSMIAHVSPVDRIKGHHLIMIWTLSCHLLLEGCGVELLKLRDSRDLGVDRDLKSLLVDACVGALSSLVLLEQEKLLG